MLGKIDLNAEYERGRKEVLDKVTTIRERIFDTLCGEDMGGYIGVNCRTQKKCDEKCIWKEIDRLFEDI